MKKKIKLIWRLWKNSWRAWLASDFWKRTRFYIIAAVLVNLAVMIINIMNVDIILAMLNLFNIIAVIWIDWYSYMSQEKRKRDEMERRKMR